MDTKLALDAVVRHAGDIDGLPAVRLKGLEAARSKLLWRSGPSVAGLMDVDPHGSLEPHRHTRAAHHLWVLEGHATICDERVGPGAYVHVPAGVEHGVVHAGAEGCRLFYLFIEEPESIQRPS